MAHTNTLARTAAFSGTGFAAFLNRLSYNAFAWLIDAQARAEQSYRLREMDDAMLKDMGITRGEALRGSRNA